MKKITKIIIVSLIFALCISCIPTEKADAKKKKNIYFSGLYQKKIGKKEYYMFDTSQYSSPDGKKVASYRISYYYKPSGSMHTWKSGELKRVGRNQYKSGRMRIRVYKKKLVITKGGEYNGTYKLKKRYPRP